MILKWEDMMIKLEYVFYIDTKPEQVWEVLVNPEQSFKAFMGGVIRSTYQVGDDIEFVGPGADGEKTVHIYGKILQFEPNRILSYTDHPGPSDNNPFFGKTDQYWWMILSNIKSIAETGKSLEFGF